MGGGVGWLVDTVGAGEHDLAQVQREYGGGGGRGARVDQFSWMGVFHG